MTTKTGVWLQIETSDDLPPAEWDRIVRRVLQSARLTRMPLGVKVHMPHHKISAPN